MMPIPDIRLLTIYNEAEIALQHAWDAHLAARHFPLNQGECLWVRDLLRDCAACDSLESLRLAAQHRYLDCAARRHAQWLRL